MRTRFMSASVLYYLQLQQRWKSMISAVTFTPICSVRTGHSYIIWRQWTAPDYVPRVLKLCESLFLHADWNVKGTDIMYRNYHLPTVTENWTSCLVPYLKAVYRTSWRSGWLSCLLLVIPVSNISSYTSYPAEIYGGFSQLLQANSLFSHALQSIILYSSYHLSLSYIDSKNLVL
jgi:hypothetical protein